MGGGLEPHPYHHRTVFALSNNIWEHLQQFLKMWSQLFFRTKSKIQHPTDSHLFFQKLWLLGSQSLVVFPFPRLLPIWRFFPSPPPRSSYRVRSSVVRTWGGGVPQANSHDRICSSDEYCRWPPWPSAITALPGDRNMVVISSLSIWIVSLYLSRAFALLCFFSQDWWYKLLRVGAIRDNIK